MITKSFSVICVVIWLCCLQSLYASNGKRNFGEATVKDVLSVYDGDTFRVNINGYPDIIGEDIPIHIAGIDTPEIRGTSGYLKEVAEKARKFTEYKLLHAKKIKLKNMRRGKYFRIVADVFVDEVNLAKELIRVGLGKEYGGGTRPTW